MVTTVRLSNCATWVNRRRAKLGDPERLLLRTILGHLLFQLAKRLVCLLSIRSVGQDLQVGLVILGRAGGIAVLFNTSQV